MEHGFEVYADADFCGNYNKLDAPHHDSTCSRTGFVIVHAGCPIAWKSKLQTEIELSKMESEIISLSTALKAVIPFLEITS